ncbi:FRG domain-containing protein [Moritella marina]|uniref:FRG domain-containing protein n=1 Tax=Moritella marina TaxID=90736 RepID=UPI0037046139
MLDEFLKSVSDASQDLCGDLPCWYRGHTDSSYTLLPTMLRKQISFNESLLFYDYKSFARPLDGISKSNWQLMLDMQHYGIPTRLLDWTSSLGTALFFALKDNPLSPCIWLLCPTELSKSSTGSRVIYDIDDIENGPPTSRYKDFSIQFLITGETRISSPYAILAPFSNSRIAAQRGFFTVHGKSGFPIEKEYPSLVRKIDIPIALIEPLKRYLNILGIDEFSLFPDHEGLSCYLRTKFQL